MVKSIRYTLEFDRIAYLKTKDGNLKIGDVVGYSQLQNGTMGIVIKFYPGIPDRIREQIAKDPKVLSIQSSTKEAKDIKIY